MERLILALVLGAWTVGAQAIPVRWELHDVEFADGGIAEGWFIYDADTAVWGSVDISTSGGTSGISNNYDTAEQAISPDAIMVSTGPAASGQPALLLGFWEDLDNDGGIRTFQHGIEGICDGPPFCSWDPPYRLPDGGYIEGAAIPIPAAVWLFGSALGLLGWMRRKH